MRIWGTIAILSLFLVLAGSTACNPFGGEQEPVSRLAEVVRGDLMVSVSGSGSIEVADEVKLAFGIGGKIDKIYVEESDRVSKGKVLATLETDDLEMALKQAELALTQVETAVTQAEVAHSQAEVAKSQAEVGQMQAGVALTQTEVAQTQAEVALEAAKFDLDRMKDVQEIKDDIEDAEWEVKIAQMRMKEAVEKKFAEGDIGYWVAVVLDAQEKVYEYKQDLADLLAEDEYATLIVDEVKIKALQVKAAEKSVQQAKQNVEQAERNVEQAKQNIEYAKKSIEYAKKSLEYSRQSVEFAKLSVEHAQKQLDDAVITAPFDGLIASVDAKEGDIIPPPTMTTLPIIHLVNPTSLEIKVEVDEIDIPSVSINQKSTISVDALPDVEFEGKVASISPLPKLQSGVVLYEVKIGFEVTPGSELKIGMSATADIIIDERHNVLLVPSRAINEDSQGNPVVRVMADGQIEERAVVPGIDDGFQAEIVSGLKEGEMVEVMTQAKAKAQPSFGLQ